MTKIEPITEITKYETKKTFYEWKGINNFQTKRNLLSIVVTSDDKTILYCKGKPEHLMDRLKVTKEVQKIIDDTIAGYRLQEEQAIIYAKRELSEE